MNNKDEQHQFLKSTLTRPGSEYSLALDWKKHVQYLDYLRAGDRKIN
jgi:hypothetical protein